MTQSVDFSITNNANGKNVIYITQDTSLNEMSFTFTYSGPDITLKGGVAVPELKITSSDPTSLYFTVSPSVLTSAEFAVMKVTAPAGWQTHLFTDTPTNWALTPEADTPVTDGYSVSFSLINITASGQAGPGSFNVDHYNVPGVGDNLTQLPLLLEEPPSIHKKLNIDLSFVDGNEVFINVDDSNLIPPNTLILRLDNPSATDPIVPKGPPWDKTPVFYLTFVTANGPPGYGALTTIDRIKDFGVGIYKTYGTDWEIQDRTQSDPAHWAIYPKSHEILGIGAAAIVEFKIDNIVTDFEPSSTNLYLQSSNIPGYDDDCQALPIEKKVPELAIKDFEAQENNVASGAEVNLAWKTYDANRCELSPVEGGSVDVPTQEKDGYKVNPTRTTTYTLTAYNDQLGRKTSKPVTVDVLDVKINDFTADPAEGAHYGDPITLAWETVSAVSCTIDPPINGSQNVPNNSTGTVIHPVDYTRYTLTANGQAGPVSRDLVVFPIPNGWKKADNAGLWDTWGRPVMLSYDNRLWFLAGGAEDETSWVFNSYDGFNWNVVTNAAAFSPRGQAAGCVFNNKIWVIGGKSRSGVALNEIWYSTNGSDWTQAQATGHWSARYGLGCIVLNGKIWIIGGTDASGKMLNDVWSSTDGATWHQETSAAIWPARSEFGLTIFNEKLCVVAGKTSTGVLADAWQSADGIHWGGLGELIKWVPRSCPNVHAVGSRLYVIGGTDQNDKSLYDSNVLNSDGGWSMELGPDWRNLINNGSALFFGAIWFAGGSIDGSTNKTVWAFGPS